MTDGCGLINRSALRAIQRSRGLSEMPTAVQGRIAGAKGLWVLDPDDMERAPRIWIADSQVKIKYSDEDLATPDRRVFDLLRVPND